MTGISTIFTALTGFMTNIVTTMTTDGNEIMLLPIGIMVAGAAIGLGARLIGR